MDKIFIKNNNLVIEIHLKAMRFFPYSDKVWLGDHIIALIEPQANCSEPKCGFAYRIDMSYKGGADQHTDFFYIYQEGKKDFKELCKKLKIEVYEYPQCAYCKGAIFGAFILGEKGNMCFNCERVIKQ